MKRTYQTPETIFMKVNTQHIMAGSEQLGFGAGRDTASDADSRGSRSWSDDEDY